MLLNYSEVFSFFLSFEWRIVKYFKDVNIDRKYSYILLNLQTLFANVKKEFELVLITQKKILSSRSVGEVNAQ